MLIELFVLMILVTLVVLSIRGGKRVAQDKPIIIQQPGRYHITLAPQLEPAQTFIEQVAARFAQSHPPQGEIPTRFFEVRDRNVLPRDGSFYLLAATYRGGLLYFQAIIPQPLLRDADSHLKQVREFSEAVLALRPPEHPAGGDEAGELRSAVETAARQMQITVRMLTEAD